MCLGVIVGVSKAQETLKVKYESFLDVDLENIKIEDGTSLGDTNLMSSVEQAFSEKYYYDLILQDKESVWVPIEKIDNKQDEDNSILIMVNPGGGRIYKNASDGYLIEEKSISKTKFAVTNTIQDFHWEIERTEREILGMKVYKATSKIDSTRTLNAWYTPELQFNSGPSKYGGLPGLILELEVENIGKNSVHFKAIELNADVNLNINKLKPKGKKINFPEFDKLKNEYSQKKKEIYQDGVDISN